MPALKPGPQSTAVVGGGLVGSLWSIFLAKRGFPVELFERRPDLRTGTVAGGRSINLAVSTRGLYALEQVGLKDEVLRHAIPMLGRIVHGLDGSRVFQSYGKDDSECIYSVSRAELNKILLTRSEQLGVRCYFNRKVTVDPNHPHTLIMPEGRCSPSWVFGTDGSASNIRAAIIDPAHSSETSLDYGYKEFHIPPGPNGQFKLNKNALHIWPRGNFMLIALPNEDGSFTVTLFLPNHGPSSFAEIDESANPTETLGRLFDQQFHDASPLISELIDTYLNHPIGHMVTVKCNPWYKDDWALLLGDAAHAIVPFFGQGMNCGFEDCTLLAEMIDQRGLLDRKALFEAFNNNRKPNSDAIADMAVDNFLEMRNKVAHPRFLMEKEVEKILQNKFPSEYVSRYSLVSFSRVPYQQAYQIGQAQDELLKKLCENIDDPAKLNLEEAHRLVQSLGTITFNR